MTPLATLGVAFGANDIGINKLRNQIQCFNLLLDQNSRFRKSKLMKP